MLIFRNCSNSSPVIVNLNGEPINGVEIQNRYFIKPFLDSFINYDNKTQEEHGKFTSFSGTLFFR